MTQKTRPLSRRTLFAGAGTVGALAATAALIPAARQASPEVLSPVAPPEKGGGYQLSERVRQYYKTTRI